MITKEDTREDYGEQRLQSLGVLDSAVIFMVWLCCTNQPNKAKYVNNEQHF